MTVQALVPEYLIKGETSGDFHGNTGKRELGVGTGRETLRSRATLNGKDSERLLSAQNETRENFYAVALYYTSTYILTYG